MVLPDRFLPYLDTVNRVTVETKTRYNIDIAGNAISYRDSRIPYHFRVISNVIDSGSESNFNDTDTSITTKFDGN